MNEPAGAGEDPRVWLHLANVSAFQGRRAGRVPSPLGTNGGTPAAYQEPPRFRSMREAFQAAAAELGYRSRG